MRSCAIAVVPRNAHALVLLLDPTLEDAANAIGEAKDDGLETLGDRYARLSRLRAAQERAPQGARVSKIAPLLKLEVCLAQNEQSSSPRQN